MNKYLIACTCEVTKDSCWLVDAKTKEEAINKFANFYVKDDEAFKEYVFERCVNMSFAEKFWMETDEETSHFMETGEVLINEAEFQKRVALFFKDHPTYSEQYLNYYLNEDVSSDTLCEELLIFIWMAEWDERSYLVVDLNQITHL